MPRPFRAAIAVLTISVLAGVFGDGGARAAEGMWTFDNFPAAAVQARYGVTIDQAWLDKVRAASLRLTSGCSASIVSGEGLVLTNHHCVSDCVQELSTARNDLLKDGVLTADRREERACPGLQAQQLETMSEVTPRILAAVRDQSDDGFVRARAAAISAIESEACAGRTATHLCQVISLHQGGRYDLYVFRRYIDVRLVFAPEFQTAFFGGDPDNFNFPRYDLDVAFLRLYERGEPLATPQRLRWNPSPPREGEPVFIPGNPGASNRLMTGEQLRTLRDVALPQTLSQFSQLRGRLARFSAESPENARLAARELFGIENSLKVYDGQLQALAAPGFLEAKLAQDAALKARVAADPALSMRIGDPWAELAAIQADRERLNARYVLLEQRGGYGSQLFAFARTLVRGAMERERPSAARMSEFADPTLPQQARSVLGRRTVQRALEEAQLAFWLGKVRETLAAEADVTSALLGRETPEAVAARLSRSRLAEPSVRRALWTGGLAAVRASDDPLIRFVLATDPLARAARREYEVKVTGPSARAAEKIAAARFALFGDSIYPDASFSPRLSYGAVEGWSHAGERTGPFTTFGGLWDRATGQSPYQLAPRWLAARPRLNDATVFNLATSTDIVGGNSGSPLLNAKAEVIGAVFDGNIHSLAGAFAYDGALNRTVSASAAATTEALRVVYGQEALVAELLAE